MTSQLHTKTASAPIRESAGAVIRPFRIQIPKADLADLREFFRRFR